MDFLSDVRKRLEGLGYTVSGDDNWVLVWLISKTQNYIETECNTRGVPEKLHEVAVDMVVGEFLQGVKATKPDVLEGIDLEAAIKKMQLGDTDVTFAMGEGTLTPEQRLDAVIGAMMHPSPALFAAFRRLKW